jgi:hypothetical protein
MSEELAPCELKVISSAEPNTTSLRPISGAADLAPRFPVVYGDLHQLKRRRNTEHDMENGGGDCIWRIIAEESYSGQRVSKGSISFLG